MPHFVAIVSILFIFALMCGIQAQMNCSDEGTQTESGFTFTYRRSGDYVTITASVATPDNTWVGIGFSPDMLMPNTDVGVGGVFNGQNFIDDRFNIIGSRGRPPYDEQQNFMDEMVTRENGVTTISFRRPVVSPDNDDDFDLNQCRWVLWANGGPITAVSDTTGATFGGHSAKGVFSRQMCLCSCADQGTQIESGFTFSYTRSGDDVTITASVATPDNTWIAVGFSPDMMMPNTDVGVGGVFDGQNFIDDRFNIIGSRGRPPYDEQQNFMNEVVTRVGGVTTISFRRPVVSPDKVYDFDLDVCYWVLWANGGSITAVSDTNGATFGGHSAKGVFSRRMCVCGNYTPPGTSTARGATNTTGTTTDTPGGATTAVVSLVSIAMMLVVALYSIMF